MQPEGPCLIVAAHPDDETIGAGIRMARRRNREDITIVHVTDGSPRNFSGARDEYARARRLELYAAVGLAGIRPDQCLELGYVDQEAYLHLPELVERLALLIDRLRPAMILTHPYEGGHPDHDAAAFAVAQAAPSVERWEFTSYHATPGGIITGQFLPCSAPQRLHQIVLHHSERELKRAMFDCFATQQDVIRWFSIDHETFRPAPVYDFSRPPHAGQLLYERLGFAGGKEWRQRAMEARRISV